MGDTDLSKSKIININDFIFRQNLEFYPNLNGLSCEDNTLYLKDKGKTIDSVLLTFDLRTLPGDAWNTDPQEFLNIIKLNKDCKGLYSFIDLMEKYNTNIFRESEA